VSTVPAVLVRRAEPRTWSLPASFALVVTAQVLLFAGSNLPTPLFPIYEQRYGFGSGTVTLLFGVYVAALIPVLFVIGSAADRIGRRPLLVAGIALTTVSSAAFAAARGLSWLFAGEIIYGVGSALVMSCVSIAIRELHPKQHVPSAALAASVAMAAGLTLGPLVGGLLASTPWPTVAPYALDIACATLLALALVRIPETRPAVETRRTRVPTIYVPREIRTSFIGPAIAGATSFMMGGWVFGLSPSFLHEELGVRITRPVVGGLFAALVLLVNGATQLLLRNRDKSRASTTGALVALVIGMAVIASSSATSSLALAVLGGVIAGISSGVVQMNAMSAVQHIAPVETRSSVMSAYVALCYVALSVPVITAGLAADHIGLAAVTILYAVALAFLAAAAVALLWRRS
jgi:MFS family permease